VNVFLGILFAFAPAVALIGVSALLGWVAVRTG